jgi:hypothetical protein
VALGSSAFSFVGFVARALSSAASLVAGLAASTVVLLAADAADGAGASAGVGSAGGVACAPPPQPHNVAQEHPKTKARTKEDVRIGRSCPFIQ